MSDDCVDVCIICGKPSNFEVRVCSMTPYKVLSRRELCKKHEHLVSSATATEINRLKGELL